MENSQINKFRHKIDIKNKKGVVIYLRALIFVDLFFCFFAVLENNHPSSPILLRLMFLNVIMNLFLYLIVQKFYFKKSQSLEYIVPLWVMGFKTTYFFILGFDINLLIYVFAMYMFLNMGIISKWGNFIAALILSSIILLSSSLGYLNLGLESFSSISLTAMIMGCFAIWSYSKYNVEYEQFLSNDKLQRNADRIQAFIKLRDLTIDLNHKIVEHVSLEEFFDYLLVKILELNDKADAASVLIEKNKELKILSSINYNEDDVKEFAIPVDYSFVFQTKGKSSLKPEIINDAQSYVDEDYIPPVRTKNKEEIESVLTTSLLINGKFYGLFNLDSTKNNIFNDDDVETMTYISEQINIVLNNHALYEQIKNLSELDQLTGFYNRWSLDVLLDKEQKIQDSANASIQMCLVDLDNLKLINDTFGHDVGDNYIKSFCDIIRSHVEVDTQIIRYGGDEFILLFKYSSLKDIESTMNSAQDEYKEIAYSNEIKSIQANFSYGIESFDLGNQTFEEVLKQVDSKMYMQKRSHKLKELLK